MKLDALNNNWERTIYHKPESDKKWGGNATTVNLLLKFSFISCLFALSGELYFPNKKQVISFSEKDSRGTCLVTQGPLPPSSQHHDSIACCRDGILGDQFNKRLEFLRHAIHSPFYWQILQTSILCSGSNNQCCGSGSGSTCFGASRIRIHQSEVWIRIRILLWIRIRILLSSCKNSKKNLDSSYFVTLFEFLSFKNYVNVASQSHKQKKLC